MPRHLNEFVYPKGSNMKIMEQFDVVMDVPKVMIVIVYIGIDKRN